MPVAEWRQYVAVGLPGGSSLPRKYVKRLNGLYQALCSERRQLELIPRTEVIAAIVTIVRSLERPWDVRWQDNANRRAEPLKRLLLVGRRFAQMNIDPPDRGATIDVLDHYMRLRWPGVDADADIKPALADAIDRGLVRECGAGVYRIKAEAARPGQGERRPAGKRRRRKSEPNHKRVKRLVQIGAAVNRYGGREKRGAMAAAARDLGISREAVRQAMHEYAAAVRDAGRGNGRSVRPAQTLPAEGVSGDAGPADRGVGCKLYVKERL